MEKVEREMAGEYPNNAKLTTAKWWGQTAKSQSVKKKINIDCMRPKPQIAKVMV